MKNPNFTGKLICAALIGIVLFQYQSIATARAEAMTAREQEIEKAEEYNKQIEIANKLLKEAATEDKEEVQETAEEEEGQYIDGEYSGSGAGFGGDIQVSVTVDGGEIVSIDVLDHSSEDPAYYGLAESLLDTMIEEQTWNVDTVSGATFSSNGLISAVEDALIEAENK